MIAFLDTSVLLKLYIEEEGSDRIHALVDSGAEVSVSSVSYVEMHSALSRRSREGALGHASLDRILNAFEGDWFQFGKIRADDTLWKRAAKLCLKHAIRSLDAIQLSTALFGSEGQQERFVFLTADKRLEDAARLEKFITHL